MTSVRADEVAVVAVGGLLGALARASISVALPQAGPADWPWATYLTNLIGCVVLGALLGWIDSRREVWRSTSPRRDRLVRPALASGFLGGFTTFSTFSVESVRMVTAGAGGQAAVYAFSSVVLGVALVAVGRLAAEATWGMGAHSVILDEDL
ncbi:MAG: CrcB family protein [Actinomycetes bacterium]